eukprot:325311-Rhodomonas_salina.1
MRDSSVPTDQLWPRPSFGQADSTCIVQSTMNHTIQCICNSKFQSTGDVKEGVECVPIVPTPFWVWLKVKPPRNRVAHPHPQCMRASMHGRSPTTWHNPRHTHEYTHTHTSTHQQHPGIRQQSMIPPHFVQLWNTLHYSRHPQMRLPYKLPFSSMGGYRPAFDDIMIVKYRQAVAAAAEVPLDQVSQSDHNESRDRWI